MKKQDFIHIMSEIEPDDFMKQRLERKVLNMSKERTKMTGKKPFKKVIAFSVCLAVVASLGVSIPVMADRIPAVKNALSFLSGEENYTKDPIEKNANLNEYAETVNAVNADTENQVAITVQDVYYDGQDIAVSYIIETDNNAFNECTGIWSEDFELYANGEKIEWPEEKFYDSVRIISAAKCDNGTFAGMINFKADVLPDADTFTMDIKLKSVQGANRNEYIFNYDAENPAYDIKQTDICPVDISCSFDVIKKNDLIKTYEINEEKEGITLNSVTVSPFKTTYDVTGLDSENHRIGLIMKDNNGNELEGVDVNTFEAPLKDTKSLTLAFTDLEQDNSPEICSFTFDIDGGYREKSAEQSYNNSDDVYIPAQEVADAWIAENKTVKTIADVELTSLDTYIDIDYSDAFGDDYEYNDIRDYSVKISNVEFLKDTSSLDAENFLNSDMADNQTLVLFDYTIRNNEDVPREFVFGAPVLLSKNDIEMQISSGDYEYIDSRDYGGTKSYHFDFEANQERTIKIGMIVNDEDIADGVLLCQAVNDGNKYIELK